MTLMKFSIPQFLASQNGAVTANWLFLTAAVIGLGLSMLVVLSGGA